MEPRAETVIVVSGGGRPPVAPALPPGGTVVAADEGLEHAQALGLHVDVAVGDFDSASRGRRRGARSGRAHRASSGGEGRDRSGGSPSPRPLRLTPRRILVLGGDAGRLDHLFAGVLTLAAESLSGVEVDAVLGEAQLHVVRRERTLTGEEGELVSLLPVGGPGRGRHDPGPPLSAERRDARGGLESRRLERLRRRAGPDHRSARRLLAIRPGSTRRKPRDTVLQGGRPRTRRPRGTDRVRGARRRRPRRSCWSRTTRSRSRSRSGTPSSARRV